MDSRNVKQLALYVKPLRKMQEWKGNSFLSQLVVSPVLYRETFFQMKQLSLWTNFRKFSKTISILIEHSLRRSQIYERYSINLSLNRAQAPPALYLGRILSQMHVEEL